LRLAGPASIAFLYRLVGRPNTLGRTAANSVGALSEQDGGRRRAARRRQRYKIAHERKAVKGVARRLARMSPWGALILSAGPFSQQAQRLGAPDARRYPTRRMSQAVARSHCWVRSRMPMRISRAPLMISNLRYRRWTKVKARRAEAKSMPAATKQMPRLAL